MKLFMLSTAIDPKLVSLIYFLNYRVNHPGSNTSTYSNLKHGLNQYCLQKKYYYYRIYHTESYKLSLSMPLPIPTLLLLLYKKTISISHQHKLKKFQSFYTLSVLLFRASKLCITTLSYQKNKRGLKPVSRPAKQILGFSSKSSKSYQNSDVTIKVKVWKTESEKVC